MDARTPPPRSAYWRTLIEQAPEAIGVLVEGSLVYANAAMARLLGLPTPEQLLGEPLIAWVHPDDVPQVEARMKKLERGEDVPRNVVRLLRQDGQTITVESTAVPGTYEGRPAIRLMVRDITEQQRTRQALQFQAKLLDAIGQAVIVTDPGGIITYWNRAAEEIFGWPAGDIIGRNILTVTPADDMAERAAEIMNRLRQGQHWEGQFTLRRRDGSTFPGIVNNRPLFDDGALTGVIGVTTDITQLKRTKATLRSRNRELETLLHVSRQLSEQLDLDVICNRVVESAVALLPDADVAVFYVREDRDEEPRIAVSYAREGPAGRPPSPEASAALAERIVRQGTPVTEHAALTTEARPDEGRPVLGVPLRVEGKPVGALMVLSYSEAQEAVFSERHSHLLQTIASQASVAIHNARLFRERHRISLQLVQTQEAERRRIAQELHDEVGALLTSLQLSLKMAHKQLATPDRARPELETARQEINDLAAMVRRISLDLRPALLDEFGLVPALRDYLKRYRQQTGVVVHFRHEMPAGVPLHALTAITAYRIIQEALTNVARYAGVQAAQVTLLMELSSLVIHVIDEGRGFDVQAVQQQKQTLGLTGMRERAALLGGTLQVTAAPGAGTRLTASLPLTPHTS